MMKNLKTYHLAIEVLFLVAFLASCQAPRPQNSPALVGSRQVTNSTLNLEEQWRIQTTHEDYSYYPPPLAIINDRVIIGFDKEGIRPESWIEAISLASGQVLWKSLFKGNISSSHYDSQRFYVSSAYYFSAYDLLDGKLLWEKNLREHESYWFLPSDTTDPLRIYSKSNELFLVDPTNGNTLSTETIVAFMKHNDFQFVYTVEGMYRTINAVNKPAQKVIWYREINSLLYWQPTIVNETLIYFDRSVRSHIVCVLIATGETCWETPDQYISNYVVVDGRLYALNENGVLIALDVHTGQELGQISFSDPLPQDPGGFPYWVAANENYVLVYFGDSQELIAFKIE